MSDSIGVFCQCGTESAYDRIWTDTDDRCLTMRRFKTLLKTVIKTLESKGITLDRGTCIKLALHYYKDAHNLNDAFEQAIETAVQHSVAQAGSKTAALSTDS